MNGGNSFSRSGSRKTATENCTPSNVRKARSGFSPHTKTTENSFRIMATITPNMPATSLRRWRPRRTDTNASWNCLPTNWLPPTPLLPKEGWQPLRLTGWFSLPTKSKIQNRDDGVVLSSSTTQDSTQPRRENLAEAAPLLRQEGSSDHFEQLVSNLD